MVFEAIVILITAWIGYNAIRSLVFRSSNKVSARGDGGGDTGSGAGSGNSWIGDTSYDDGGGGSSDGGGGGGDGGD